MHISIVIIAFNYAHYLNQCLDSCLHQETSGLEYEVIVVDDGSTDGTKELLANRKDARLRTFHLNNRGIEIASNHGFKASLGQYVVRVDADDILKSNYLKVMSNLLVNDSNFIYSDYEVIDHNGDVQEIVRLPIFSREEVLMRGDFLATGTIYPRSLLETMGWYNTIAKNSGLENYELIIKLMQNGIKGVHVARPLFCYRRHSSNISSKRATSIIMYGQKLFKDNCLGIYSTNEFHPYKLVVEEKS